jgi:hypothetical protein
MRLEIGDPSGVLAQSIIRVCLKPTWSVDIPRTLSGRSDVDLPTDENRSRHHFRDVPEAAVRMPQGQRWQAQQNA